MNRIMYYKHDGNDVPLAKNINSNKNTYTVIVGKNGIGKSRLLTNMASHFSKQEMFLESYGFNMERQVSIDHTPRVIAVSTSPFDKFQLPPKKNNYITNYRYVGMRSNGSYGSSPIALISSATNGILERYLNNENKNRLLDVFQTLGFSTDVQLIFKPNFIFEHEMFFSGKNINSKMLFDDASKNERSLTTSRRLNDVLDNIDRHEANKTLNAIKLLSDSLSFEKAITIGLDISNDNSFNLNRKNNNNILILESLNTLLKHNLVRLMDFRLHKSGFGHMSLRRASSGEQCMLVIMLGIAGHINDNSLIFIDEPEISLHPKWQEDFMPLLIKAFDSYVGCQFFIATHSPQIISNLNDDNCFVTSLSKNVVFTPDFFRSKSSDFQLAELFDAPGSRNEYISRLAFGLLSRIKKNKTVNDDDRARLDKLRSLSKLIDNDDPIYELIKSIEEVVY